MAPYEVESKTLQTEPVKLVNIKSLLWGHSIKCYVTQGGWVAAFPEKSVTKVYGSTLLALRGGGGKISREKAIRNT